MYVCMYACMYPCMHVCMHVCMYACMHACMHACMLICSKNAIMADVMNSGCITYKPKGPTYYKNKLQHCI